MKKLPVLTSLLLVAAFLATTAFSPRLPSIVVDNGAVSSYIAGKSLTIRTATAQDDFVLRSSTMILPSDQASGLGAGARVTVYGQCFTTADLKQRASNQEGQDRARDKDISKFCYALVIYVRLPASAAGNTGSAGTTGTSATPTPAAGVTPTATP